MGSLTLSIKYRKNTGVIFSVSEFVDLFFFGTPPIDLQGNYIPDSTIEFYIKSAQKQIENVLSIKLIRQCIQEQMDYLFDDWINWGYIPTNYPVVAAKPDTALQGYINTSLQIQYPNQWISVRSPLPDEDQYRRSISLVPISGSSNSITNNIVYFGISPYVGYFGNKLVPNYWTLTYITGFHRIPDDMIEAIGKKAAISVFAILGDIVIGAGVASKSQSVDGLSQSISTTASAMYSAYSARINQYEKDLKDVLMPEMKARYVGITLGVC